MSISSDDNNSNLVSFKDFLNYDSNEVKKTPKPLFFAQDSKLRQKLSNSHKLGHIDENLSNILNSNNSSIAIKKKEILKLFYKSSNNNLDPKTSWHSYKEFVKGTIENSNSLNNKQKLNLKISLDAINVNDLQDDKFFANNMKTNDYINSDINANEQNDQTIGSLQNWENNGASAVVQNLEIIFDADKYTLGVNDNSKLNLGDENFESNNFIVKIIDEQGNSSNTNNSIIKDNLENANLAGSALNEQANNLKLAGNVSNQTNEELSIINPEEKTLKIQSEDLLTDPDFSESLWLNAGNLGALLVNPDINSLDNLSKNFRAGNGEDLFANFKAENPAVNLAQLDLNPGDLKIPDKDLLQLTLGSSDNSFKLIFNSETKTYTLNT